MTADPSETVPSRSRVLDFEQLVLHRLHRRRLRGVGLRVGAAAVYQIFFLCKDSAAAVRSQRECEHEHERHGEG